MTSIAIPQRTYKDRHSAERAASRFLVGMTPGKDYVIVRDANGRWIFTADKDQADKKKGA